MRKISLIGVLLILFSHSVFAFTPTPSQIQQFNSLPQSQKSQIISEIKGRSTLSATAKSDVTPEVKDTVKPMTMVSNTASNKGGLENLKPFGHELFAGKPTTFAPVNDIPVPTDYMLGVGDQLTVHIYGTKTEDYSLTVDRNGQVSLPRLGPVTVAGMVFSEAKALLVAKLRKLGVGVNAAVNMGEMRSFRIFVLGESRTPGSYLVSGMATITHALYVSGGLNDIASYRNIELKRRGKLIGTLDLYDLLLKGDTSHDLRLQPGDTVFIPKRAKQVAVYGDVMKPALYELKNEKDLSQVLALAGGIRSDGYRQGIQISRLNRPDSRSVFSVDVTQPSGEALEVKDGDQIKVSKVTASIDNAIQVIGAVTRPGVRQWKRGLRVSDLLPDRDSFEGADMSAILLLRQGETMGPYEVHYINWYQLKLANGNLNPNMDLVLRPRDKLFVLPFSKDRQTYLDQINGLMNAQSSAAAMSKIVTINGSVKFPGTYPLTVNMHVKDLISLCGGLNQSAMLNDAEIIRYGIKDGDLRQASKLNINLNQALQNKSGSNIALKPFDSLMVKRITDWSNATQTVTIKGEVAYPGTYTIMPGDTMQSLLTRAGGFTKWAAPENAVFTREFLKKKESVEMNALADELEKSLLFSMKKQVGLLEKDNGAAIVGLGQSLVDKVRKSKPMGRLVIGLSAIDPDRHDATLQLPLRNGDSLYIPKCGNEVMVMGEVSRQATMLYQSDLSVQDYLDQAGGLTKRADVKEIYIVRGDGSIVRYGHSWWDTSNVKVRPGDTIVVPMDVESLSPLITWSSVTKILSNLAITAATLQTIGVIN